jgi:DNA-binding response OmpR family regulator
MDMGLRDKDGAVIVQELEAINPSVKIFIVSGQDKKKLEFLFATHLNVSVIQKPFGTFEFLHMVNARLAQTT